jgi:hypothetical protein
MRRLKGGRGGACHEFVGSELCMHRRISPSTIPAFKGDGNTTAWCGSMGCRVLELLKKEVPTIGLKK